MSKLLQKIKNRLEYEKKTANIKKEYKRSLLKELRIANAKNVLKIETYDSKNSYQAMHPSIVDFKEKWNGWRYWMGYTPYTFGNEYVENPCIAVSNDLITWQTPKKIINPIENTIDSEIYHWSDIHLTYRKDKNQLECWYRKREKNPNNREQIFRVIIKNGKLINKGELMFSSEGTFNKFLSPVILYDYIKNRYQIWVVEELSTGNRLKYFESKHGDNWMYVRDIKIVDNNEYEIWHMDIKKCGNLYEIFYCGVKMGKMWLFYTKSTNNITYDTAKVIMQPSRNRNSFDNNCLYRPSFFIDNNKYHIFYSAENKDKSWGIGHSISMKNNPTKLIGV